MRNVLQIEYLRDFRSGFFDDLDLLIQVFFHARGGPGKADRCNGQPVEQDRCADAEEADLAFLDRKSTRLNSSHPTTSRMPSSA